MPACSTKDSVMKGGCDELNKIWFMNGDYHTDQTKLRKVAKWILSVLENSVFIYSVSRTKKQARDYYNDFKKFCVTYDLSPVNGFDNQRITVYLPNDTTSCCDTTNTTLLMRVLPVDKLPTIWGSNIVSKYGCRSNTTAETVSTDPTKLSDREKVLYFYYKNSDFFVNLLSSLKTAIVRHANFKNYCKVLVFPDDLYEGDKNERTLLASGQFLKQVYDLFLINWSKRFNYKLEAPVSHS